ncbi:hypothetical protein PoB_001219700 [Plakobranchus ocellatus]|uniref:Uncharacterized protein n=1 Tax=Plakobranchus ocellatus TaxID=259542 RepID=A0AAV3YTA4_9GAST|nr:hypothetical protein PoB_001219700 [Plakobranchus ocellatus]
MPTLSAIFHFSNLIRESEGKTHSKAITLRQSLQQGDLRLLGPPSGRGTDGGARTRDRRVPADLRADSKATVPPTPPDAMKKKMKVIKAATQEIKTTSSYLYRNFFPAGPRYKRNIPGPASGQRQIATGSDQQSAERGIYVEHLCARDMSSCIMVLYLCFTVRFALFCHFLRQTTRRRNKQSHISKILLHAAQAARVMQFLYDYSKCTTSH